jgi:tripartite-type tricarboxylate transporter receptor subunit TctC
LLSATIAALSLVAIPRAPAEEFYKGKTITFVVGFSAGGGFDTYTRLIARHFAKHIPGNPTVVVENKTGAGSLIAANYIYNQAPHDGTVIGNWIGPLVLQQVLGNKAAKFDGRKFGWLGVPTPDSGVCALTKASGIKTMDDWFKSKRPIKIGGTAPGSTTDDVPNLLQAALGLPMKLVEGYKGTAKIRLAAESGEIDGGCWAWESIKPTWAKGCSRVRCTSSCRRRRSLIRSSRMCLWQCSMPKPTRRRRFLISPAASMPKARGLTACRPVFLKTVSSFCKRPTWQRCAIPLSWRKRKNPRSTSIQSMAQPSQS